MLVAPTSLLSMHYYVRRAGIHHNEIRDLTAALMSEVCHNVSTEPHLQPMTGEIMSGLSAISRMVHNWILQQLAFRGVNLNGHFLMQRFLILTPSSNQKTLLSACYHSHENEKKRKCHQRICEVEHASFTPLILSCTGGLGPQATTSYKRLISLLSAK